MGEEGSSISSMLPMIGFLVLMGVGMYFLMIRPQRQRQKEQEEVKRGLRKGDKVVTASGIYGRIESLGEDNVVLELESGATMRVTKSSILGRQSDQLGKA